MNTILRHLSFFVLMMAVMPSFAASITAQTDRSSISLNESFTLQLEATGSVDADPDLAPLEQDFDILSRSQSSNISYINGNYSQSKTWTLHLMAKREGLLTIPAIAFGQDSSPQLRITVKPAGKADPATQDIFVEAELSSNDVYVQQQLVYTLRLLTAVNLSSVNFSDLKTDNIDTRIEPLDDGRQYRTQRGNRSYLVVEKKFALFPQQPGTLHIPAVRVEASLGARAQHLFDPFNRNTQLQRFRSQAFDVRVQQVPAAFKGKTWLPASELQLVEEWPDAVELKTGEPITRTVSLLANGLTAEQLPSLSFPELANIKQYPDQASLNNSKQDDGIIGIHQQKIALMPVTAGRYTLPAMDIPWWNTTTDKMEVARLPARTFEVRPSASPLPPSPAPADTGAATSDPVPDAADATQVSAPTNAATPGYAVWLSLLFACGWAGTALAWWWSTRKQAAQVPAPPDPRSASLKHNLEELQAACDRRDARACRAALLDWGRIVFGESRVHTLDDVARLAAHPALHAAITALDRSLYSSHGEPWDARSVWQSVQQINAAVTAGSNTRASSLEPLYKLTG